MSLQSNILRPFLIVLAFVGTACSTIDISTKFEPGADFTHLKTFKLFQNQQERHEYIPIAGDVFDSTLKNTLLYELTSKGYTEETENADFLVSYYITVKELRDTLQVNSYYADFGYNVSTNGHPVTNDVTIVVYPIGSLIIDIIDLKTKSSIWRGSATTVLGEYKEQEKKVEKLKTAIRMILEKFPPEQLKAQPAP